MRNFRTAAVAAATAVSVAFGGTAIASAEENNRDNFAETLSSTTKDVQNDKGEYPTLSSKWGAHTESDEPAFGANLFGKRIDDSVNPTWSTLWRDGTAALGITSVIGAIIGAYNYAVYNGIIPQHILDPIFR